jgi:hypothetical protein
MVKYQGQIGSEILMPKLRNQFYVDFYVVGTDNLHPYSYKIAQQIVSIDVEPKSAIMNNFRFTFEDDILSEAVSSLQDLKSTEEVFDVVVSILDGNYNVVETIKYERVSVSTVYRKDNLSYECKTDETTVSLYTPEIVGNLVESFDGGPELSKLLSSLISNTQVTIKDSKSKPIAVRRVAVLSYGNVTETYHKGQ